MGRCDVCGNDYEKTMVITTPERTGTFDPFEYAGVPERKVNA
jgi:hypothetical protein